MLKVLFVIVNFFFEEQSSSDFNKKFITRTQ